MGFFLDLLPPPALKAGNFHLCHDEVQQTLADLDRHVSVSDRYRLRFSEQTWEILHLYCGCLRESVTLCMKVSVCSLSACVYVCLFVCLLVLLLTDMSENQLITFKQQLTASAQCSS